MGGNHGLSPGSTVTKLRTVTPVRHRRGLSAAPRRVQAPAPVWGMVQAAPARGDVVPAPATGRGPDPEMGPGRAVPGVQRSHVASGLSTPYGFQSVLNTVMRTQPRQQLVGIVDEPLAATAGTFGVLSQVAKLVRVEAGIARAVAAQPLQQLVPVMPCSHGGYMSMTQRL
jgi:hypothetical protein